MNTYRITIVTEVNIDAFTPEDAVETAYEIYGEGHLGAAEIVTADVTNIKEI